MTRHKNISETLLIGALLAVVGGFLDAYTYLCRGGVFANAQTGNIVLVGMHMAQGNFWGCLYYLVPIIAFAAGIFAAEAIKQFYYDHAKFHWRQVVIAFETLVLFLIAFIPQSGDMLANVLVSFVCALQVQSFRKMYGNAYATTMCTGNLRSATECLWVFGRTKNPDDLQNSLRYYSIIVFFVIGAVLGALLTRTFGMNAIFFACVVLAAVFALLFVEKV
ncbi:YoaK family protein [Oscillospiraceae bacterium LTW-04]|nr:YoaK family protein [Oscillospiraceae bacterium MB24-C1]